MGFEAFKHHTGGGDGCHGRALAQRPCQCRSGWHCDRESFKLNSINPLLQLFALSAHSTDPYPQPLDRNTTRVDTMAAYAAAVAGGLLLAAPTRALDNVLARTPPSEYSTPALPSVCQ